MCVKRQLMLLQRMFAVQQLQVELVHNVTGDAVTMVIRSIVAALVLAGSAKLLIGKACT